MTKMQEIARQAVVQTSAIPGIDLAVEGLALGRDDRELERHG